MKHKIRTKLIRLDGWMNRSGIRLYGMARELRSAGNELPAEFSEIHQAVAVCQESIQNLSAKLDAVYEADKTLRAYWWEETPTDAEISQLLALNRRLRDITPLLISIAEDVTPRLEAKLADPNDPMYDYEIEARLDFILREDDPEYDEDNDNILTTRSDSLKCMRGDEHTNWAESNCPEGLEAEPHCWRFHDLYDHDYGAESPRLSFHDCLRIGKIYIDVQVWQQYDFDVTSPPTTTCPNARRAIDE